MCAIKKSERGFTLIELAISIMILGLIISTGSYLYSLYLKDRAISTTHLNKQIIMDAIGSFRAMNGRYPCPANMTDTRDIASYGHETDCSDQSQPVGCNAATGMCIQTSTRTVQFRSGGTLLPPENPRVRVGYIPFRELGITQEDSYDGYGMRFRYAVTERLAVKNTFQVENGGIEILNDQGVSIFNDTVNLVSSSGHFIVISHGEDQAGGYTRDGVQIPCSTTNRDRDNCTVQPNPVYRLTQTVTASNTQHFDDEVAYFTQQEVPLWQRSDVNPAADNIHQIPPGNVAVFVSANYSIASAGEVQAPLRARANMDSDQICDANDPTICFPSSLIAGDDPNMECPPGEFATGIANNQIQCAPAQLRCPPGKRMTGIAADGTPSCTSCGSQDETICSTTGTLPAANDGATYTLNGGANYYKDYECVSGTWTLMSQGGNCTCTPQADQTRTVACAAGTTGTGTLQTRTYTCPAGTWSGWVNVSSDCSCNPITQTRTRNCASGFTGIITQQRTRNCPANNWTGWTTTSDTCTCVPSSQTRTIGCSGGLTGNITQSRDFVCPSGNWTSWTDTSNTCTCTPQTETQVRNDCPTGYNGTRTYSRTLACPSGNWSPWSVTTDNCTPIPPRSCNWRANSSPLYNQSNSIGSSVNSPCTPCGTSGACYSGGGSSFTIYPVCSCE